MKIIFVENISKYFFSFIQLFFFEFIIFHKMVNLNVKNSLALFFLLISFAILVGNATFLGRLHRELTNNGSTCLPNTNPNAVYAYTIINGILAAIVGIAIIYIFYDIFFAKPKTFTPESIELQSMGSSAL